VDGRRFSLHVIAACVLFSATASGVHAQATYPEKPVTFISDAAAGASPDVALRIMADGLGKVWGQNAVVVNHPGANGSIAARAASDAIGDGYTLYAPALSTFIALPGIAPNLPIKLPRDFLPIGFIADQPMFFAVSPASGITSMSELIGRAKKDPGNLSIAVSGVGRVTHLTGVLMQQQAGITLTPVPYTGGPGAALSDVASGRVTMMIEGFSGIIGAVNAGQVKLIAVASPKRLAEFPDLPTVGETLPGFVAGGWLLVAAPLGTPAPVIPKVSADMTKVLSDPEVEKKLSTTGSFARVMTPDETRAFVVKQQETWAPVLAKISTQ
jgi:tripartite-type tricarboxylate transporter receptor subunit TctC